MICRFRSRSIGCCCSDKYHVVVVVFYVAMMMMVMIVARAAESGSVDTAAQQQLNEGRTHDSTQQQRKVSVHQQQQQQHWDRPDVWKKAETARWMVHNIDWGVLTTISSRMMIDDPTMTSSTASTTVLYPFGNVYSFIDGPCTNATGIPYFYGSYMDQSFKDMTHNTAASLTLSEASLLYSTSSSNSCRQSSPNEDDDDHSYIVKDCSIVGGAFTTTTGVDSNSNDDDRHTTTTSRGSEKGTHPHRHRRTSSNDRATTATTKISGDPENPVCARLTLTGRLVEVPSDTTEYQTIQEGFYQRHPSMQYWPIDHHWVIVKLQIEDIWLIDYFGGATILSPEQYFSVDIPALQQQQR